jgi:hypothetical protein
LEARRPIRHFAVLVSPPPRPWWSGAGERRVRRAGAVDRGGGERQGGRFAQVASASGYATFALIRKEDDRPIYFDPVREARRGLEAAVALRGQCNVESEARKDPERPL